MKKFLKIDDIFYLGLILIIIIVTYLIGIENDWHISTQGSLPFWFAKNIAATISQMEHNLGGYVGYNKILFFL